jgi:hypothetical protein
MELSYAESYSEQTKLSVFCFNIFSFWPLSNGKMKSAGNGYMQAKDEHPNANLRLRLGGVDG